MLGSLALTLALTQSTFLQAVGPAPRIAIRAANLPLVIHGPGSYYLAESIHYTGSANAITIDIANATDASQRMVTIDLNGHTLRGPGQTATGGSAIYVIATNSTDAGGLVVHDGMIAGWPQYGIQADVANVTVRRVSVQNTGSYGIFVDKQSTIEDCTLLLNGLPSNAAGAIVARNRSTVRRCNVERPADIGIRVLTETRVEDCVVTGAGGFGINAQGSHNTIRGCQVSACAQGGIYVGAGFDSSIERCKVSGITAPYTWGITLAAGSGRAEANEITDCVGGLSVPSVGNTIRDNLFSLNGTSHSIVAGNSVELLVNEAHEVIYLPCKARLIGDVQGFTSMPGIDVAANDVTIDLAGHSLVGGAVYASGIRLSPGYQRLTVKGGNISDWGQSGIDASNGSGCRFEGVSVQGNALDGIATGYRALVDDCIARSNGRHGFNGLWIVNFSRCLADTNTQRGFNAGNDGTFERCNALGNLGEGFRWGDGARLVDCVANSNALGGFYGGSGNQLSGCVAHSNNDDGYELSLGNAIERCVARANRADGIRVGHSNQVTGCTLDFNGNGGVGAGVHATGNSNRIDGNNCVAADYGIDLDSSGNTVVRNSARGNTDNYGQIVGGNDVGPIGTAAASTSPWANIQN